MTELGFHARYGRSPDGSWVAPGRVNIIGEHTDYNDGFVLPIALPHVVHCDAAVRADRTVRVVSRQHSGSPVTVDLDELARAELPGWSRYPLGVVAQYRERGLGSGVDLYLDGEVPVGAGLSSSAAVECAVAIALRDLFELNVSDDELIALTSAAENDFVGVPTGTLDQSASILCSAGHALFLDVGTGERAQIPFDLAAAGCALLVIDTNTPHALVAGEYAERRRQCRTAADELGVSALREVRTVADLSALTDPLLARRARHVVTENARVLDVVETLRSGKDPRTIGAILTAGHASLRDDFEVSTIQLDTATELAVTAGAHGARMVGGGFGGSVIALVDEDAANTVADVVAAGFARAGFATPRLFTATPAAGARRLH